MGRVFLDTLVDLVIHEFKSVYIYGFPLQSIHCPGRYLHLLADHLHDTRMFLISFFSREEWIVLSEVSLD